MTSLLLFGYGNPGRGDDALGPLLIERIAGLQLAEIVCQQDMQLQVEHVTDLATCDLALFVDADMSCSAPLEFSELTAVKDTSYSSHAMTPAALLHAYQQVYGKDSPPAFLLRIRGYEFELGDPLSTRAIANLDAANGCVVDLCATRTMSHWQQRLTRRIAEQK
ncbi:MAG TPA: hydrogenase maturation protease [Gallionella sp.]|nr:hydrogenase maturation protease [Gallionella sp.]